jgi:hypothetical protein
VTIDERPPVLSNARHGGSRVASPDAALATAPRTRYQGRLVLASLLAGGGFAGWTTVLAVQLPSRYVAGHWNVAWAGFDVMLLVSLIVTGWVFMRRPHLAATAFVVTAALLVCDAWFDVTTASGSLDTAVSVFLAVAVELPLAAALAWFASRQLGARRPTP